MKDKDIIETITRLDGWVHLPHLRERPDLWSHPDTNRHCLTKDFKFLTSRDAIIRVIAKQPIPVQVNIGVLLREIVCRDTSCYPDLVTTIMMVLATPSQLCEALLRATGHLGTAVPGAEL